MSFTYMALKNNLPFQVIKQGEEVVEQLVVPKPYSQMVLDLVHGHILGGHLDIDITKERIVAWSRCRCQRIFWSCPECQYSAPTSHFRSLLLPLLIIEVPFERTDMDLMVSVIKSARGPQHTLVILAYVTRYPEGIPLRNPSVKAIA